VLAKAAVQTDQKEKQGILTTTKGQEKTYQQLHCRKAKASGGDSRGALRPARYGRHSIRNRL